LLLSSLFLVSVNLIAAEESSRPNTEAYGRIKTDPLSVRQPIYSSSVARWKRFEPWLGPLRDVLADG
jgi:hypothetical protein